MHARRFSFDESLKTLAERPSHRFTRPTVLLLTQGVRYAGLAAATAAASGVTIGTSLPLQSFVPQRAIALHRLKIGLAIGLVAAVGTLGLVFWGR